MRKGEWIKFMLWRIKKGALGSKGLKVYIIQKSFTHKIQKGSTLEIQKGSHLRFKRVPHLKFKRVPHFRFQGLPHLDPKAFHTQEIILTEVSFNLFHATGLSYPLKTWENQNFQGCCKKRLSVLINLYKLFSFFLIK